MTSRLGKGASVAALLAGLVFAGCGGEEDNLSQFLGKWSYSTGSEMATCAGQAGQPNMLSGDFQVSKGTDAPLVIGVGTNCNLRFDASGSAATVRIGQTCSGVANGVTVSLNYTAGTMIVTGLASMLSAAGNFTINANGQTLPCTFTQSGTATKLTQ